MQSNPTSGPELVSRRTAASRRRRAERRWSTRFGSFIDFYSVKGLLAALKARGLPLDKFTLYGWLSGDRDPRPNHALALVEISRGSLSLDDVYSHRRSLESADAVRKAA